MEGQQGNEQGQQRGRKGVRMQGGRVRTTRGRWRRAQLHKCVPDEIRAANVDHVLNHCLTMTEPGWRVLPNIETIFGPYLETIVSSLIKTLGLENRWLIQKCSLVQFIHSCSLHRLSTAGHGKLGPISADYSHKAGYTLDRPPIHRRAYFTYNNTV